MSTYRQVPPPLVDSSVYNILTRFSFGKAASILVMIDPASGTYQAVDGVTGQVRYGGPNNAGSVSGSDPAAVLTACGSAAKIYISPGKYTTANTAHLTTSFQTVEFDAGVTWTYTGTAEAFKIGSDTQEVRRTQLHGNFATITRTGLGGTYGVHLENCHLCRVDAFIINNFATAEVFLEGSWSSWVTNVEVPNNPGSYGVLLRKTQAGNFTSNLNDLARIHECWLQGTTAAVWNRENSEDVEIEGCAIHDSPVGILDYGSRNLKIRNNYFENNAGYCVDLNGTDAQVVCCDIEGNFLATNNNVVLVYVENANIVNISKNDLNPPSVGCTFVSTPNAGTRCISLDRNRLGVPTWVTEYAGDAGSLVFRRTMYDSFGNPVENTPFTYANNTYLQWEDNAGAVHPVMSLAGTNILIIKNFAGQGNIQLSPEVLGGYILFFDDGANNQIAKWTKDWAQAVPMKGSDPGGLGSGDLSKLWYNTAIPAFRYWDGGSYRTLFMTPANQSLLPDTDGAYDLGQTTPTSYQWRNLFLSGNVNVVGEIYVGQDIRRVNPGLDLYVGSSVTSGKGLIVWNWVDNSYGPLSASYIQCYNNLWIQGNITGINALAANMPPAADNTYSLGNAGLKYSVIYGVNVNASNQLYAGSVVDTDGYFAKGGVQVVGARQSDPGNISDTSGTVNDGTCRAKVNSILQVLRNHGLIG
jgi:hypothetical protein